MAEPTEEQLKLLAALASGYQSVDDRTRQLETVFKDSIIIPGNKTFHPLRRSRDREYHPYSNQRM